jgi:hypothetical protein
MRAAIAALGDAFTAVGEAHAAIIAEARAVGATERADAAEVDDMLGSLTALWSARFGGGETDAIVDAPPMFAVSWDGAPPGDPALDALSDRADELLDAWAARTEAWRALAHLERRSLSALDALRARQRDYAARFAAAKAASVAVPVLQALRDELIAILERLAADPDALPRPAVSSARRRAGAGLAESHKLVEAHGAIPGLAETAAALVEVFTRLRDAFELLRPPPRR